MHVYSLMAEVFKIENDSNKICHSRVSTDAKSNQCLTFFILLASSTTFDAHDNSFHLEALFSVRSLGSTLC